MLSWNRGNVAKIHLTCQWLHHSRPTVGAAAWGAVVLLWQCPGHWFEDSGWAPGWWGYGSEMLQMPGFHHWSQAAWRETIAAGLESAPPGQDKKSSEGRFRLLIMSVPARSPTPTWVMLLSVILEQADRSSSWSPLIASREAPICSRKAPRSSSVTRRGFSWKGRLGGWKKPMLPKVRVKLGPLSSWWVKDYSAHFCLSHYCIKSACLFFILHHMNTNQLVFFCFRRTNTSFVRYDLLSYLLSAGFTILCGLHHSQ